MKIMAFLILLLLMPYAIYSQTDNRKALESYNSGMDKFFKKNYTGAITDFSETIKYDSVFIQAYENRGVAKYYLQDYRGALDDFNKALKINPNDYNTYGRRGWAKFYLQDSRGAIDDFTKAIEGGRNDAQYYNIRGRIKYNLQDYKGAMDDFNRVIKFRAGDKEQRSIAYYWRGLVEIDLGQKDNGCLDLHKADKLGYAKAYDLIEIYCK
jgi:tetratricopeptide (TPR) repeat protein